MRDHLRRVVCSCAFCLPVCDNSHSGAGHLLIKQRLEIRAQGQRLAALRSQNPAPDFRVCGLISAGTCSVYGTPRTPLVCKSHLIVFGRTGESLPGAPRPDAEPRWRQFFGDPAPRARASGAVLHRRPPRLFSQRLPLSSGLAACPCCGH